MSRETVKALAERLSDAYSTDRYRSEWAPSIKALRAAGYDDRQIEAIIRSKWTRWAADAGGKRYGQATAKDLMTFVAHRRPSELAELVQETFS